MCTICSFNTRCVDAFEPHAQHCHRYLKIEDNKITEANNVALYEFWLRQWSDIMSYPEYKNGVMANGTKVIEDDGN